MSNPEWRKRIARELTEVANDLSDKTATSKQEALQHCLLPTDQRRE